MADRARSPFRTNRSRSSDAASTPVRVLYSDHPGEAPPFQPRGSCPDWTRAIALVQHHLGPDVAPRVLSGDHPEEVVLIFNGNGHCYRLEGPSPGPS